MNAHVISPSLKDFVRYQVSSEMSLLTKVLPWLCPFSANSTAVLLNREESCRLCSRWDSCRKLFCAHLGVASCRAFLVSGAENSQTQELVGPFSSRLTTLCHWLCTSSSAREQICLSLRDVVKSCDTKNPAWSNQLCTNPALHPAETPHPLPACKQPGCLFGWHAGMEAGLGGWTSIKSILELWADQHFGSCYPSPLMRSLIP